MSDIEYIDNYFKGELPAVEKQQFDQRILDDPAFAGEVAFYISSHIAVLDKEMEAQKERLRELYEERKATRPKPVLKLWRYAAAAAAVAGIILASYLLLKPGATTQQLADSYIQKEFKTLGVTMGSGADSLQPGLQLYNEGAYTKALQQFENIIQSDTSSFTAKKYAGIVSLRLKQYDKALSYFTQLEKYTGYYANPATFYHALTLLERNLPGDAAKAKQLLQQVVQNDLEEKDIARQWLEKW